MGGVQLEGVVELSQSVVIVFLLMARVTRLASATALGDVDVGVGVVDLDGLIEPLNGLLRL